MDYLRSFLLRKEEECYSFEEFALLTEKIRDNVTIYEDREIVPTLISCQKDEYFGEY